MRRKSRTVVVFTIAVVLIGGVYCLVQSNRNRETNTKTRYGFATFTTQWDSIMPGHQIPKKLYYCFYPSNNGAMIQTEGDAYSLRIALPPDAYRLIVYNADANDVRARNLNKFDNAEATISTDIYKEKKHITPLYAVVLNPLTVYSDVTMEYSISPKPVMQNIRFKINVQNIDLVKSCEATISSIASSLKLNTRYVGSSGRSSVSFFMDRLDDGFERELTIFKVDPLDVDQSDLSNLLKLEFFLHNGKTISSTIDLGRPIHSFESQSITIEVNASVQRSNAQSITFSNWEMKTDGTNKSTDLL